MSDVIVQHLVRRRTRVPRRRLKRAETVGAVVRRSAQGSSEGSSRFVTGVGGRSAVMRHWRRATWSGPASTNSHRPGRQGRRRLTPPLRLSRRRSGGRVPAAQHTTESRRPEAEASEISPAQRWQSPRGTAHYRVPTT